LSNGDLLPVASELNRLVCQLRHDAIAFDQRDCLGGHLDLQLWRERLGQGLAGWRVHCQAAAIATLLAESRVQ
jgi:hypothetical protein